MTQTTRVIVKIVNTVLKAILRRHQVKQNWFFAFTGKGASVNSLYR